MKSIFIKDSLNPYNKSPQSEFDTTKPHNGSATYSSTLLVEYESQSDWVLGCLMLLLNPPNTSLHRITIITTTLHQIAELKK